MALVKVDGFMCEFEFMTRHTVVSRQPILQERQTECVDQADISSVTCLPFVVSATAVVCLYAIREGRLMLVSERIVEQHSVQRQISSTKPLKVLN